MKRIISFLIITAVVFSGLCVFCTAVKDYPEVKGLILEDAALKWEPYTGADAGLSWIGVDGAFAPFENGDYLDSRISEPGEYALELMISNADNDGYLADSLFYCKYDGKNFTVIDKPTETETGTENKDAADTEEATKDTTDYGDGIIKNVTLSEVGVLKWDEYEHVKEYELGIDRTYIWFESGSFLPDWIEVGEHTVTIEGYNQYDKKIARWRGYINYDGEKFEIVQHTGTETEKESATESKEDQSVITATGDSPESAAAVNTALIIILVVCTVLLFAAITAFIIVLVKLKKSKAK